MKHLWSTIALMLATWMAHGQTLKVTDTKFYANNNRTAMAYIPAVIQTKDGGYCFVGKTGGPGGGPFPLCPNSPNGNSVMGKLDSTGAVQWIKNWCDTPNYSTSLCQTPDGGYAINGGSYPYVSMSIFRYNATGNYLWRKDYGKAAKSGTAQIINTPDNGFLLLGYAQGKDTDITVAYQWPPLAMQPTDWVIIKLDSLGRKQWVRTLGTSGDEADARITCDGKNYYLIGLTQSKDHDCADTVGHPYSAIYTIKLDQAGNVLWSKAHGNGVPTQVIFDNRDNSILVTGYSGGGHEFGSTSEQQVFLMKLDTSGNFKWGKLYGNTVEVLTSPTSVVKGPNGGYFLAGTASNAPYNGYPGGGLLVSVASNGKLIHQRTITESYGRPVGILYYYLLPAYGGAYAAFGQSGAIKLSEGTGQNIKYTDTTGCLTLAMCRLTVASELSVPDKEIPAGSLFTLSPNPARGSATLLFEGAHPDGWLTCTGSSGKTVLRQRIKADQSSVVISTEGLPPGICLVCWQTDQRAPQCQKLVVQ